MVLMVLAAVVGAGMDLKDNRVWYWVGVVVPALFVSGYGAGWFNEPISGAPLP